MATWETHSGREAVFDTKIRIIWATVRTYSSSPCRPVRVNCLKLRDTFTDLRWEGALIKQVDTSLIDLFIQLEDFAHSPYRMVIQCQQSRSYEPRQSFSLRSARISHADDGLRRTGKWCSRVDSRRLATGKEIEQLTPISWKIDFHASYTWEGNCACEKRKSESIAHDFLITK